MKKCFAIHPLFAAQIEVLLVTCLKSWRSYPAIGRISMRARTAYRFDVWMGATLPFLRVLLAFLLWRVLFTSRSEIAGFTLEGMTAYYILTAFLSRLDQSGGLVWEYADDIREGRFAKYLTKPLNPFGHFLATSAARSLYVGGVALASVFLLALLFGNRRLFTSSWQNALMAGIIALLGLSFLACLNWLTAILAWKFKDITGFHLIKGIWWNFLPARCSRFPCSLSRLSSCSNGALLPPSLSSRLPVSGPAAGRGVVQPPDSAGLDPGDLVVGEISWRRLRRHDEGVGA
jgi:ABC-type uncharacterized transport system permease subunit